MNKRLFIAAILLLAILFSPIPCIPISFVKADSISSPAVAWQKTYNQTNWTGGYTKAYCLIQTNDEGYVIAGVCNSNIYLGKISASGNLEWNRTYGTGGAMAVVQTNTGEYVVACDASYSPFGLEMLENGYVFDPSNGAIVLLKVDSSGNLLWNQTLVVGDWDQTNFLAATSMVKTSDGGYAVGGYAENNESGFYEIDFLIVKADSQGKVQWVKTYGGPLSDEANSIIQTTDGGYALAGYTGSFGSYNNNYWLVKTDANGNLQWTRTYGKETLGHRTTAGSNNGLDNQASSKARSVVQTSDGGYALLGYATSTIEKYIWLVKTDSRGSIQWNQTYGSIQASNDAYSVIQTSDGGYAIAGSNRTNIVNGPRQILLSKTDALGNEQWAQKYEYLASHNNYPVSEYVEPVTVIQTKDGGLAVLGTAGDYYQPHYFFLWKTAPFLPQPSQTVSPTPSAGNQSNQPPFLTFPTMTIRADGSVTPPTAPLTRNGNTYKFTNNFSGTLAVEKDNLIVDGGGYTLQGNGSLTQTDGTSTFIQITPYGVFLANRANVTIRNLQVFGYINDFHFEGSCSHNLIEGNIITGDSGTGIFIRGNATANQITRNTIKGLERSMYLWNSSFNLISENTLKGASMGDVVCYNGLNDTFSQNLFVGHGLEFYQTSGNNLTGNTFSGCMYAIQGANGAIISRNNLTSNSYALYGLAFCKVTGNNIQNNRQGIVNAYNSTFYQNNFINNTLQTAYYSYTGSRSSPLPPNVWDNGTKGNYWSNYNGTDQNGDGIGDTPYIVDANNQDNYPLISPLSISVAPPPYTSTITPASTSPAPTPLSTQPSLTPTPAATPIPEISPLITELPAWIILPLAIITASWVVLSSKRKTRKV